jgi:phospholipase C
MKRLAIAVSAALCAFGAGSAPALAAAPRTPIKHLIVVVGENVTFDTLFATYTPASGASVRNLLSRGIVTASGAPGPNYASAVQYTETNPFGAYAVNPTRIAPYAALPPPTLIGAYNPATLGLFGAVPDPRFPGFAANGPFQISTGVPYLPQPGDPAAYPAGDPVHRFFQMWQQNGGNNRDLHGYAWVALTTGQGGDTPGVTVTDSGQGSELMGFFNMASGDAPVFHGLADAFAMSDNYHQAIQGGTGANFFALATGDVAVYNTNGTLAVPPANQIENPNPQAGTANFYARDGYSGGSYVNCSDESQPGVAVIRDRLRSAERRANCAMGAYYLVNNYDPPFDIHGTPKALGSTAFVYPPQSVPTIAEALTRKAVSWRWYTGGRDAADVTGDPLYPTVLALTRQAVASQFPAGTPANVVDTYALPAAFQKTQSLVYNTLGDPLNASSSVVGTPLAANLAGLASFYSDVAAGTLPSVSWVVPKNLDSGHPGYSAPARYEVFLRDLVARVQANPALWASTAIVITTDEGGGYFDSGAIQMLDFFGDGPRIPLVVVSPFARKGYVDHTYLDHASILKFIELNWGLKPLSSRSRDRLPNPVMPADGYLPDNGPAIGDLTSLFQF